MDTDNTNECRVEAGSVTAEMELSEAATTRNRFNTAPPPQQSFPNDVEGSPTTTEGTLTPGSAEEATGTIGQDDFKGKLSRHARWSG